MLFHSQEFLLLFLPLVLALAIALEGRRAPREWVLIAASFAFYGWWDIRFLPLLAASVVLNWAVGQGFARWRALPVVWVGVPANLAVLGYFKYRDFFAESLGALTGTPIDPAGIVLPIGISFFTFQQISYLIDLKRGRAGPYGLREYALYISFFPQLIAGPIVRHHEFIPQLGHAPDAGDRWERLAGGFAFLFIGLVKKVGLADQLAPHVDAVYAQANAGAVAMLDAWTATGAFALQIYFDFSAYSDMAIGLALMLGLRLPYNFDAPYRAVSIRDFWRRWHMTLSRFFRDYLYIPLGGNRHGIAVQAGALIATMALCGLWHGAGWTFVLWGLAHGAAMVVALLWRQVLPVPPAAVGWAITLSFTTIAWVPFRAESAGAAWTVLTAMAGLGGDLAPGGREFSVELFVAGWALVLLAPTSQKLVTELLKPWRAAYALAGVGFAYIVLELGKGQPAEFIYFQF